MIPKMARAETIREAIRATEREIRSPAGRWGAAEYGRAAHGDIVEDAEARLYELKALEKLRAKA